MRDHMAHRCGGILRIGPDVLPRVARTFGAGPLAHPVFVTA